MDQGAILPRRLSYGGIGHLDAGIQNGSCAVIHGGKLPEDAMLDDLLHRCRDGDAAAFRRLYDAESPRLYGLALRITGQAALAADAVHDAFLQVWQKATRFDPGRGSAGAWLTALVRYRAIDL